MSEISRRDFLKASGLAVTGSALGIGGVNETLSEAQAQGTGGGKQIAGSVLSLPKGGGAVQGIGETFSPNQFTGTANFTVPIATSPGRAGFGPELSLQYSSGKGNGPFGLGWELSVPQISRKTEKGIPQYQGNDTFLLSGAEDLVLHEDYSPVEPEFVGFRISTYRPRVELFARIQFWEWVGGHGRDGKPLRLEKGLSPEFWRITTKDNITNLYGRTSNALLADPKASQKIFQWFLQFTYDAKGNYIHYQYLEDSAKDIRNVPYEGHRITGGSRIWQTYLKRIRYGNLEPLNQETQAHAKNLGKKLLEMEAPNLNHQRHFFEVVFDYGEHGTTQEIPDVQKRDCLNGEIWGPVHHIITDDIYDATSPLPYRCDPFSSYRSGFEIRSYRRCQRVLMFHNAIPGQMKPVLVKSTDFQYREDPYTKVSCLKSVTQRGYRKVEDPSAGTWHDSEELNLPHSKIPGVRSQHYYIGSFPPVEFGYTSFTPNIQKFQSFEAVGGDLPPRSLADPNFALVDLFGTGLPDIIQTFPNNFFVWRNLGNGQFDMRRPLKNQPAGITLDQGGVGFGDMAGDGRADLLIHQGPKWHFYEATYQGGWKKAHFYKQQPSFSLSDPNVKMVDLTGDGKSDVLRADDRHFTYFPCMGEEGFGEHKIIRRKHNLEDFPDVFFNDPRVRLVDLSGDGLKDIALIHSGRIDYWPNLGHGEWGARATMQNTPHFGANFDPRRLLFADLDGSGPADMVYVESGQVKFWLNQSGNAWSEKQVIHGTPEVTDLDSLEIADMFGTGTSGLLYSTDYRGLGRSNYWFLDLAGGIKPYVLTEMTNNLGVTTRAEYSTSTQEYLKDLKDFRPWITTLPFPVMVLKKVEVIDHIGKSKLATTYGYRHGYYNGREREFRGFGMVEQTDSEVFEKFSQSSLHDPPEELANISQALHVPPLRTKTWFHTGVFYEDDITTPLGKTLNTEHLLEYYREDYYNQDLWAFRLDGGVLEPGKSLSMPDLHMAYRALRGSVLRTEVYALDGTEKEKHPYSVTESRYQVKTVQPKEENQKEFLSVFFPFKKETLTYHYERNPLDPRIAHDVTLHMDDYGNVTHAASWVYPRRPELTETGNLAVEPFNRDPTLKDYQDQSAFLGTLIRKQLINPPTPPKPESDAERSVLMRQVINDAWFVGVTYETQIFEIHKIDWDWTCYAKGLSNITDAACHETFRKSFSVTSILPMIRNDEGAILNELAFKDYTTDMIDPALPNQPTLRLIEWSQTYYKKDDKAESFKDEARLRLGTIESRALPFETYQTVYPKVDLNKVYSSSVDLERVRNLGGYVEWPSQGSGKTYWWIPSGRQAFDSEKFYQPTITQDPFGKNTTLTYDDDPKVEVTAGQYKSFWLLVKSTNDPVGNMITAENDYYVLQPQRIMDPNDNLSQVAFDPLGLVVGTAVRGKGDNPEGDFLEGFHAYLTQKTINDFIEWKEIEEKDEEGNPRPTIEELARPLLREASTRLIYDLWRPRRTRNSNNGILIQIQPAVVTTITREIHASDPVSEESPLQLSFTYSDGFGREIQTKVQAEPDLAHPDALRWLGTGWTIFNNKGKPVQQHEPFFDQTHTYTYAKKHGVSSTLLYDPLERVVATLHPNHTYEKVIFDPWCQETWDTNDTLLCGLSKEQKTVHYVSSEDDTSGLPQEFDPTRDRHVRHWFSMLDATLYSPTWYQIRMDETLALEHWPDEKSRKAEQCAAKQTEDHAATPTITHLDTFGRAFLTIADNGKKLEQETEERFQTYTAFDIQGNDLKIRDPRGIDAFTHSVDMTGRKLKVESVDAGTKSMLPDVAGNPIWSKDGNENEVVIHYDALRRPLQTYVKRPLPDTHTSEQYLAEVRFYGDGPQARAFTGNNPEANNLRGQLWKVYDGAGLVHNVRYDFKGNLNTTERALLVDPKTQVRWESVADIFSPQDLSAFDGSEKLETVLGAAKKSKVYQLTRKFDALNRVILSQEPDGRTIKTPTFNKRNLLKLLKVVPTESQDTFVQQITYNEKGQRVSITYGNEVETRYEYDSKTFRLLTLTTNRKNSAQGTTRLQALQYSYDPVGNIVVIQDHAHKEVFRNNARIRSESTYTYDPTYRLIEATGREHEAMTACHYQHLSSKKHSEYIPLTQPLTDGQALDRYHERYMYDPSGNIRTIEHHSITNLARGWVRTQLYDANSNRLQSSNAECPNEAVLDLIKAHDANGNIKKLPHLSELQWDYKNQLIQVQLNTGSNPGHAYYQYDGAGQRVRKFLKKGKCTEERIYLGEFEIYRKKTCDTPDITRHTMHVMDDQTRVAIIERKQNSMDELQMLSERTRYQLTNHLGSSVGEVDATNDAGWITYVEYYPYGGTAYLAGKGDDKKFSYDLKRYRYSGKERDDETGLYYYGARYYAPWIGRWLHVDPAGPVDEKNLYLFVKSSPIKNKDKFGLITIKAIKDGKIKPPNTFVENFNLWEKAARPIAVSRWRSSVGSGPRGGRKGTANSHILEIFSHDFTAETREQIVQEVPDIGKFSYVQRFGEFVNVGGFPLDIKHFMKFTGEALRFGETLAKTASITEEYYQSLEPRTNVGAWTSAFSPEDLISNQLGIYFSRHVSRQGDIAPILNDFLKEVGELFRTNQIKDPKFLSESDVKELRNLIGEFQGTKDFRNFQVKLSAVNDPNNLYNPKNIENRANQAKIDLENSSIKHFVVDNVYRKIK
jgi:RHS repeat-associated protein